MQREHITPEPTPTKLADLDLTAAKKPDHTAKDERVGRVVLWTRLERPLFYLGLFAPAALLVALWLAGVF
jgi:hypothetical protein